MTTILECEALKAKLAEAMAALHSVAIGGREESIQNGEKRITYSPANAGALRAYIADLRQQINDQCGGAYTQRRVIHFIPTDG